MSSESQGFRKSQSYSVDALAAPIDFA
jgi:hypothetical protein